MSIDSMIIQGQKGYTLLFAIIVSSIVLSIATFVLSITRKQFILASMTRDSTVAIYAADSGIQCAAEAYAQAGFRFPTDLNSSSSITCSDQSFPTSAFNNGINSGADLSSIYNLNTVKQNGPWMLLLDKSCAVVYIYDGMDNYSNHVTVIDSDGYNVFGYSITGEPICPLMTPRTTERTIRLVYHD